LEEAQEGIEERKKKRHSTPPLSSHCLQSFGHFFLSKYTTSNKAESFVR